MKRMPPSGNWFLTAILVGLALLGGYVQAMDQIDNRIAMHAQTGRDLMQLERDNQQKIIDKIDALHQDVRELRQAILRMNEK